MSQFFDSNRSDPLNLMNILSPEVSQPRQLAAKLTAMVQLPCSCWHFTQLATLVFAVLFLCPDFGVSQATSPTAADGVLLPIPNQADQDRALALIREVYAERFEAAKSKDQRGKVAIELLEMARRTNDDFAAKYVALNVCRKIAISADDTETAFEAIAETAEKFRVDRFAMTAEAGEAILARLQRTTPYRRFLLDLWLVVDEAVAADQYESVGDLGKLAIKAAPRTGVRDLEGRIAKQLTRYEALSKRFEEVRDSRAKLEVNPTDKQANRVVGEYLCFDKQDWDQGVFMLALVDDCPYRNAVLLELEQPRYGEPAMAVGDAWWEAAETLGDTAAAKSMQQRAAHWYGLGLRSSTTSLKRQVVQKRIDAAGKQTALLDELTELAQDAEPAPLTRNSSKTTDRDDDGKCSRCRGTGLIDCSVRGCSRGRVKVYQSQVVGRNPASGQAIVQRVPVRVPCQACRAQGNQQCPECRGSGE